MDKNILLDKFDKFCAEWIKKAEPSLSITEILQHILNQVLPGLIHMTVEHLNDEKIIGSVPYRNDTSNVIGYMHGGTIFTTGDTLAGAFLWTRIEANQYAVTTSSEIKYLKPFKQGILRCTVTEKSRQDRNVVLEAVFEDVNGQMVSVMSMNYLLMSAGRISS